MVPGGNRTRMTYGPGLEGLPYRSADFNPGMAGFSTHRMSDSLVSAITAGSGSAAARQQVAARARTRARFIPISYTRLELDVIHRLSDRTQPARVETPSVSTVSVPPATAAH